jgi:excisionase family DNA binding protein
MCTFLAMPDMDPYAEAGSGDDWLTIGEAASVLGLSIKTLRRYDEAGRLKAVRTPGGQRRYRRSQVAAAMREPAA